MTGHRTARPARVTEQQKARARLILLTVIGILCPPLAGVRSLAVWICYIGFVALYSLWAIRLVRNFAGDRRLGYLLCLTDTAILLPLMVWTASAGMLALLVVLCAVGLVFTYGADRARSNLAGSERQRRYGHATGGDRYDEQSYEVPLERALRVRLRMLQEARARFALVVLRIVRFEEMNSYYGEEAATHILAAVSRRALRLLGPDAQHFVLSGGRVAFVFATGTGSSRSDLPDRDMFDYIDPYDVESFAMALARKACEHLIDGHRVECVVGWASAPADGMTADDLMYAAESGAQSAAAFRRVAGSAVPVPEKTRVAAG